DRRRAARRQRGEAQEPPEGVEGTVGDEVRDLVAPRPPAPEKADGENGGQIEKQRDEDRAGHARIMLRRRPRGDPSSPRSRREPGPKKKSRCLSIRGTLVRRDSRNRDSTRSKSPGSRFRAERRWTMRFLVLGKATKDSEAGVLPDQKDVLEMGK